MVFTPNTVATQVSKYQANAVTIASIWGGIIYNVKASPYLAKGDGVTDDTTAFQAAIDAASVAGGGTVIAPFTDDGYNITSQVTIPKGVLLLGSGTPGAAYLSGGTPGTGLFQKSYFILDGLTVGPAFVLEDNSGIENIGFYYKTVNTQITTGDVPTFPWTIEGSGYGLHLKNLSVMGASHFIRLNSFERGTIDGIYGLVTKMAFRIKRSRDISRIRNVHLNPNIVFPFKEGASSEGFSTYFTDLMKANLVAFRFGSADFHFMENVLTIFTNKFIDIVPNLFDDGQGEVFDDYPFTMQGSNIVADATKYGLYIQRPISFTMKFTNLEIVPINDDGLAVGITLTGNSSGLLSIANYESKGTAGKTSKHVVIDTSGVAVLDMSSARLIGLGTTTDRSTFTDLFTVSGNSKMTAEILLSKTNSAGVYRTVIYDSGAVQYPNGLQINGFSLEEATNFTVYKRDGADVKTPVFAVDSKGGLSGSFSKVVINAGTDTVDMRGANNLNGRGLFLISADFPGNAFVFGYCNGSSLTAINVGADAAAATVNPDTALKLNVFMSSTGVLGVKNNLGSDRTVTLVSFPSVR